MDPNRTLHQPLGWFQGDPLVICRSNREEDIMLSFTKLRIKAYYAGPMVMIPGRRFDKVYFDIHATEMSHKEFVTFWRWVQERVYTCSPVGGFKEVVFV
jgi:hypothetical protein